MEQPRYNVGLAVRLRLEAEDLSDAYHAAADRRQEARRSKHNIERQIEGLKREGFSETEVPGFRPLPGDIVREREVAHANVGIADDRVTSIEARLEPLRAVVTALEHFLRAEHVSLVGVPPARPAAMPDGSRVSLDDLTAVRQRIGDIAARLSKADRRTIVSEAECDTLIDAWLDAQQAHAVIDGRAFAEGGTDVRLLSDLAVVGSGAGDIPGVVGVLGEVDRNFDRVAAWLVALGGTSLRKRLKASAAAAAAAAGGWGPPATERAAIRRELEAQRFAASVLEEQIVQALEHEGVRVDRRAAADPRAMLLAHAVPENEAGQSPLIDHRRDVRPPERRPRVARSQYLAREQAR